MNVRLPRLFRWSGGKILPDKWSFGYLTGYDHDLVCVKSSITDKIEAETTLSPICANRFLAISAFALKRILLSLDDNSRIRRSHCGNPNKGFDNQ